MRGMDGEAAWPPDVCSTQHAAATLSHQVLQEQRGRGSPVSDRWMEKHLWVFASPISRELLLDPFSPPALTVTPSTERAQPLVIPALENKPHRGGSSAIKEHQNY